MAITTRALAVVIAFLLMGLLPTLAVVFIASHATHADSRVLYVKMTAGAVTPDLSALLNQLHDSKA